MRVAKLLSLGDHLGTAARHAQNEAMAEQAARITAAELGGGVHDAPADSRHAVLSEDVADLGTCIAP